MLTIEALSAFGADTAEGLSRCCNNEMLSHRPVRMIPAEKDLDHLKAALCAEQTKWN